MHIIIIIILNSLIDNQHWWTIAITRIVKKNQEGDSQRAPNKPENFIKQIIKGFSEAFAVISHQAVEASTVVMLDAN